LEVPTGTGCQEPGLLSVLEIVDVGCNLKQSSQATKLLQITPVDWPWPPILYDRSAPLHVGLCWRGILTRYTERREYKNDTSGACFERVSIAVIRYMTPVISDSSVVA